MKRSVFWISMVLVICLTIFFTAGCFAEAVDETAQQRELKRECLSATMTAIKLEMDRYQKWLDLRKQQGDTQAVAKLEQTLTLMRNDLEKYRNMAVDDYILPEKVFLTAGIGNEPGENSLLYIDMMSRSGPFYHVAGITGGDYGILQPETPYNMVFFKVYPRNYWHMQSDYVYIASLEKESVIKTKHYDQQGGLTIDPARPVNDDSDGFLGWSWGSRPREIAGVGYLADITSDLAVFSADFDISSITGEIRPCVGPRLVFSQKDGLVQVHIDFEAKDFNRLKEHLTRLLGEPAPIVHELWAARVDFSDRSEWHAGDNTRVVLATKGTATFLEIGKEDFTQLVGRNFEQMLAEALLKQAQDYDSRDMILEAVSIYQTILNNTESYSSSTNTAQEYLAAYSQRKEVLDYMSKDRDMRFYRLINIFAYSPAQQWIRIELGPGAQTELQSQRPSAAAGLTNIGAVLCRVRIDPVAGKYMVAEQFWLDETNQIIGCRPAWAPQDTGWPVPYIRQACEDFLTAWFSLTAKPHSK